MNRINSNSWRYPATNRLILDLSKCNSSKSILHHLYNLKILNELKNLDINLQPREKQCLKYTKSALLKSENLLTLVLNLRFQLFGEDGADTLGIGLS